MAGSGDIRPGRRVRGAKLAAVGAAALLVAATTAEASPAFARKYKTSCVTCHTGFPNLNSFGRAFKMQGYRMPGGDEDYVEEDPVELGAEAWKRVFPDAYWPNSIPGTAPFAVKGGARVVRRSSGKPDGVRDDFVFPTEIGIIAAGTIGDSLGGWISVGVEGDSGEVEVERAFVTVSDIKLDLSMLFDGGLWDGLPDDWLNLRVGRLEAGMLAFDDHAKRLTMARFPLQTHRVGLSPTPFDKLSAIEAFGVFGDRLSYAVGLTTGRTGTDNNNAKDVYGRLAYKLGGITLTGVDGDGGEDDEANAPPSEGWVETSLELGVFGYSGRALLEDPASGMEFTNRFWRAGVDARLAFYSLELLLAGMWGNDRDAFNRAANPGTRWSRSFAGFVEGRWVTPWPWAILGCRYEYTDTEGVGNHRNALVPFVAVLARANVKLQVEASFLLNEEARTAQQGDVLQIGLDIAF